MDKKDLLLEIGTEEIPARFMPSAINQLGEIAEKSFADNNLSYENIKVLATPRRLVLKVRGLDSVQPDSEKESKGPSKKAAFDENGQPSKALQGFLRSQGLEIGQLTEKEVSGNVYLYARKTVKGREAKEILPDILFNMINKISFPKPMRWAYEEMRFARPIHWLIAILGDEVLPLTVAGVTAGRITRGHRVLGNNHIIINSIDEYEDKLAENYVIVDQDKRHQLVSEQIAEVAKSLNGIVNEDEELLSEVVFLIEYPTALHGSFDRKFLEIPEELVITPMREHQRYFPVYDGAGKLLPYFITVRNGDDFRLNIVAQGNEKVLKARLADAEFFWNEDCKTPLENNLKKLSAIVYHEKLGSLYHKVESVQEIAHYIGHELGYDEKELTQLDRASYLMKADLVSRAVYEFTELQGIMGEYYALKDGEDEVVAQAIREHYQPRFFGDELPATHIGTVCAIADKIFGLVGFFAVGIQPTGSQDPYALRRAAIGITQIIVKNKLEISIKGLVAMVYDLLQIDLELCESREDTILAVYKFIGQRLENFLSDEGIPYDIVNSVMAAGHDNLYETYRRAVALDSYRKESGFNELLAGFTRAANILKKNCPPSDNSIESSIFEKDIEKALYQKTLTVEEEVKTAMLLKDYAAAFISIGSLRQDIDTFFNDVMVIADDEKLRNNRLALLSRIVSLTDGIGDLSLIVD